MQIHTIWVLQVVGSNPAAPTNEINDLAGYFDAKSSQFFSWEAEQVDRDAATIVLEKGDRWLMTPRQPGEPQVGVIWTA
jgi:hypothetical protein